MENKIYCTNANGLNFTLSEVRDFLDGKGYHGHDDCDHCPYNKGMEQGAAHICGPCGQQNCWVEL